MNVKRIRVPMHFLSVMFFVVLSSFIADSYFSKSMAKSYTIVEDVRVTSLTEWIAKKNPKTPAKRIAIAIIYNADLHGIDPYMVASHMEIESHYNPSATGLAGERGLLQMSMGAAERCTLEWQMAFDIEENIRAGTCYMAIHMGTYKGNMTKAVYRYNGGGDPAYVAKFNRVYTAMVRHISPDKTIIVKYGDTLSNLSLTHYGNIDNWKAIAVANQKLTNPDLLVVGQKLTIPSKHSLKTLTASISP